MTLHKYLELRGKSFSICLLRNKFLDMLANATIITISVKLKRYEVAMNFEKQNVPNCLYCGRPLTRRKKNAKFCSDRCRLRSHRSGRKSIEKLSRDAHMIMSELERQMYGRNSLIATEALRIIEIGAKAHRQVNSSSVWHCLNCGKIIKKEEPDNGDCECGHRFKDADWRLQKTMI